MAFHGKDLENNPNVGIHEKIIGEPCDPCKQVIAQSKSKSPGHPTSLSGQLKIRYQLELESVLACLHKRFEIPERGNWEDKQYRMPDMDPPVTDKQRAHFRKERDEADKEDKAGEEMYNSITGRLAQLEAGQKKPTGIDVVEVEELAKALWKGEKCAKLNPQ